MKQSILFSMCCLLFCLPGAGWARTWQATVAGQVYEEHLTSEMSLLYQSPLGIKARLVREVYDGFLSGDEYRWGAGAGYGISLAGWDVLATAGLSDTSSLNVRNQLSFDIYFRVHYWKMFFESDAMFYSDGLYARQVLALAWPVPVGSTMLEPMLGVGTYLNTDYTHILYPINLLVGVRYAF